MIAEATKTENPMASYWSKAALVRRSFKAGPRRKMDLVYDAERAFLECRILYTELRKAMLDFGIETGASDVSVGLVLMAPWESNDRRVYVVPAGGSLDVFAERGRKAERLEKRHSAVPIGVAFWQRDREANQEEVWVRPWRMDSNPVMLMVEVKNAMKTEKGNEFELEF